MNSNTIYESLKLESSKAGLDSSLGDIYVDPQQQERCRRMGFIRVECEIKSEQIAARQTFKKVCALTVYESFFKNCISDTHFQRLTAGLYQSCELRGSYHYTYGTLFATGHLLYYSEFPSFLKNERFDRIEATKRGFTIPNKTLRPNVVTYKIWADSFPFPAALVQRAELEGILALESLPDNLCVKTCKSMCLCEHEHQEFELSKALAVLDLKISSIKGHKKRTDHQMSMWIERPKKLRGHEQGEGSLSGGSSKSSKKQGNEQKPTAPEITKFKW